MIPFPAVNASCFAAIALSTSVNFVANVLSAATLTFEASISNLPTSPATSILTAFAVGSTLTPFTLISSITLACAPASIPANLVISVSETSDLPFSLSTLFAINSST